jgi:hypothetical protein
MPLQVHLGSVHSQVMSLDLRRVLDRPQLVVPGLLNKATRLHACTWITVASHRSQDRLRVTSVSAAGLEHDYIFVRNLSDSMLYLHFKFSSYLNQYLGLAVRFNSI